MSRPSARDVAGRHPVLAVGALLALAWLVTLTVPPWSDESVGDLGVRSAFASQMLGGELPYRDFAFEYPPLAAPPILLAGLAGTGEEAYRLGIAAVTLALALALLPLVRVLARRTGGRALPAMLTVAAAPLLLGAVIRLHVDLLPVALLLAALAGLLARRPALGLALVGLGAMAKGFPIVAAPVALAWLWGGGDRRGAAVGAASLVATLAVCGAAWLALSADGALDAIAYQLDRPVQVESSPASVLFAAGWLGSDDPAVVHSHRSAGLSHPLDGPLGALFAGALVVAVALLSLLAARASRRTRSAAGEISPEAARALVLATLAAVAAFAAFGRVLSPQFLVWCVPLLAMAVAWRLPLLAAAAASACLLTQVEFPWRYVDLVAGEPAAAAVAGARNAALVGSVAIAAAALAGEGGERPAPSLRDRPPGRRAVPA